MSQAGASSEAQAISSIPDDTDLLIRSTSSLLNSVHRQVQPSERMIKDDTTQATQLDQLALLLVDTRLKSQAAAATAILSADSIDIYSVASEIHVTRNCSKSSLESRAKNEGGGEITNTKNEIAATPPADWMIACLSEGPFGAERHAVQLEYLIGEYTRSPAEAKAEAHTNLTRYIYFHCLPKLQQSLKHHVAPDRQLSFLDILCNRKILDLDDISSGYCPLKEALPSKLQTRDETWLHQCLRKTLPNYKISLAEKAPGGPSPEIAHVVADVTSSRATFYFLRLILESIVTQVGVIDKFRAPRQSEIGKEDQKNNLRKLKEALDSLINKMEILSLLARHSVSVWHLLGQKTISNAFKCRPEEKKSTGLSDFASFADDEDDCDTYIDANGTPGYEPSTRDAAIRWLKCLTQWQDIVENLRSGALGKLVSSRTLRIHVARTSPPSNPTMQASLEETLQAMYKDEESPLDLVAAARSALVGIAHRNLECIDDTATGKGKTKAKGGDQPTDRVGADAWASPREKWEALACADKANNWCRLFSGAIHCECALACEMEGKGTNNTSNVKDCFKTIGVSTRCCYTCHVFLQKLNPQLAYAATHGKVYPWALPDYEVPILVKQEVLEKLQDKLRRSLRSLNLQDKSHPCFPSNDHNHDHFQGPPPQLPGFVRRVLRSLHRIFRDLW